MFDMVSAGLSSKQESTQYKAAVQALHERLGSQWPGEEDVLRDLQPMLERLLKTTSLERNREWNGIRQGTQLQPSRPQGCWAQRCPRYRARQCPMTRLHNARQ